ncbi:MAG: hypothetical protein M1819_002622 [Sarea resinae]|nr:MAG: hypothetical protein M1819_002622 [Sarea resinae]
MAQVDVAPSFGAELKDAFKPVNAWVANGILWLDDIQQFYRERSAIEREYAAKLNGLAKKYFEKKAKKTSSLSVGETPTMTPGSLESASLTTWGTQLSTLESRAAEHDRFSTELISHVADPLRAVATRYEELRRRHADYAALLEKERDGSYADLKKVKANYDVVCQEVENRRKKIDSSFDSNKGKAQNAYQQQLLDMHNVKNTYIISINVTNKLKERYYHEYIPELLDSMQDLSETRTAKLNSVWSLAAQLETSLLSRSLEHLNHLSAEIPRNSPHLDSAMFAKHNAGGWQEPADMAFEPSPVWHDDDVMVTDEAAKVFLRNVLGKGKGQLSELRREVEKKRKEVENVKQVRTNIKAGKDKRDEVEVVQAVLSMQGDLHQIDHKRLAAEVEVSTITSTVGDVTLGASTHDFKSQTFKIPTNCDLCGERIWGLSAKGFDCRDCGYTCHSKCEMKVPAECPGEQTKEQKKKLKVERQDAAHAAHAHHTTTATPPNGAAERPELSRSNTMNSLSSGYATSAQRTLSGLSGKTATEEGPERSGTVKPIAGALKKNRVVAPPPAQYVSQGAELNGGGLKPGEQRGKMMYAYQSNGDGELTVDEGQTIVVVEPDDGSGWMRVRAGSEEGLIPAAYAEIVPSANPLSERPASTYSNSSASLSSTVAATGGKKKGPAVAPKRGAKKLKYVEALYDYEARSEAEWNMAEGDRFVLINKDSGDGWADVEKGGETRSVPANYIQEIS